MNGRAKRFRYAPLAALAVVVLLCGGGVFLLVRSFLNSRPQLTKQVVQEIHLVRPPPPPETPPPPPPPEEKVQVHEQQQQPDPKPSNDPPPSEHLGVDAEGGAGGDAFGLLGNKGGRELLASGGNAFSWYAGLLKGEVLQVLQDDEQARRGSYSAEVKIWVRSDGSIEQAHLVHSTGDRERDKAIESALSRLSRISQGPPADMPQPISLRIVSRA